MLGEGGAWGSWPALSDNLENKDGKMVHSDAIWYDILICTEIFESQESRCCILTPFETYYAPGSASGDTCYWLIPSCLFACAVCLNKGIYHLICVTWNTKSEPNFQIVNLKRFTYTYYTIEMLLRMMLNHPKQHFLLT